MSIKQTLKCFEAELSTHINYQTRERLQAFLTQQGYTVYGGQKRLVVMDPAGQYVYKIACDLNGIQDNINEVACSEKLKELCDQGLINRADLNLFALASIEDGDPFVIKQELGRHYDEDSTFIDFYNKENQARGGNKSTADIFPIYVNTNEILAGQYNRIVTIISKYFVASDVSITREPRNYGFNPHVASTLVLFDMGSMIPVFKNLQNQLDYPVCPKCGNHTMVYVPFVLGKHLSSDTLMDIGGQYGCTNPNCSLSIASGKLDLNVVIPTEVADQNVFNKYFREHMPEVNVMNLIYGYSWLPLNPLAINSIVDLRNDIYNATKGAIVISNDADMTAIWNNYMTRSSSIIISAMPEILDIPVIIQGGFKVYTQFYQELMQFISSKAPNTFENIVIKHLAAMLYLRSMTVQMGAYDMYAELVEANNLVLFRQAMSRHVSMPENEIALLFSTLKGV
jgi:hypothetical protein